MDAVFSATDARVPSTPTIAIMWLYLDTIKSIIASFDYKPASFVADNSHDQARRLWYRFREYHPRCACGIVRLISPVPNDLVGIVTAEDLLGMDIKTSRVCPTWTERCSTTICQRFRTFLFPIHVKPYGQAHC